jgi:hypothetical protein
MTPTPYVAIICTAERLTLRDDPPGPNQRLFFNLNVSTAVVQNGAGNDATWRFIEQNRQLLKMWDQHLNIQHDNVIFSVFAISHSSPHHISIVDGSAAALTPHPACAPCRDRLHSELEALISLRDLTLLVWDPTNPSPVASSPNVSSAGAASVYRPVAWHNLVAHASTWPKPIPQGLNLSFEVAIPNAALANVDSVVIFPQFVGAAVETVGETAATSVWASYGGQYFAAGSPHAAEPLWAYEASCPVNDSGDAESLAGLVDMQTYWVTRDRAAAVAGTSNWRQSLEATIASRFDYFPRLLNILEEQFEPTASPGLDFPMWDLGLQMLEDLSGFGHRSSLEGSTLQQALILRAVELAINDPTAAGIADSIVAALQGYGGQWRSQVLAMLQNVDRSLASAFTSSASPPVTPGLVIATLRRLYAALSNDTNLGNLVLNWWDDAMQSGTANFSPSIAEYWPRVKGQLSGTILPRGQLHKRYLSAIAANARPPLGVDAPTIQAALGTAFPGRMGHTASLIPSWQQMLVFAGDADTGPLNDVWMMGIAGNTAQPWTQVLPGGKLPAPRAGHTAAFDDNEKQLLIFGGLAQGDYANDLWRLKFPHSGNGVWTSNAAWALLQPLGTPPAPRTGHSAVYDPGVATSPPSSPPQHSATMIVFGGEVDEVGSPRGMEPSNDVWLLENATGPQPEWLPLRIAFGGQSPAKRSLHTAVYDPHWNQMIVFGGLTADGHNNNDVWVLSNANGTGGLAVWSPLAVGGQLPPRRRNHTAVYDTDTRCMVVFGGLGDNSPLSDVWILSLSSVGGAQWSQGHIDPAGAISARESHTAIYQPSGAGSPPEGSPAMIVFSGGPDPVPDVWALSDPLGSASWSRLNPSGNPQLDSAVKAAIRGWVYNSAFSWSPSLREELDAYVAADLNAPQTGLATVADDAPAPTQRPQALVVQVGDWNDSGQDVPDEDLRRVAGFGLLIRKAGNSPPSAWRCVNAADVVVHSQDSPSETFVLYDEFVPIRLQYRSGMKDPFIDYDNQPKIAKSAATKLSGKFQQSTNLGSWANNVPLFSYRRASGVHKSLCGLVFGVTYECAPFAIGHGGAMPVAIEQALAAGPLGEIDFEDPDDNVIRRIPYYRQVPVGHLRILLSASVTSGTWEPLDDTFAWPPIPATVYPLARDLGLTRDGGTGSTGDQLPFLLLSPTSQNPDGFSFGIQAPTTDINTWDRWVANGSTYQTDNNTKNTRIAVWAAFHRDCSLVGAGSPRVVNVATNRIGDPAVAALLFRLERYDLDPNWTPGAPYGHWTHVVPDGNTNPLQLISFQSVPSPPDSGNSSQGWQAVWAPPVPITVKASTDNAFHLTAGKNGGYIVLIPPGPIPEGSPPTVVASNIARLTVTALVRESDFDERFEPMPNWGHELRVSRYR